jgi:hypothetical protein
VEKSTLINRLLGEDRCRRMKLVWTTKAGIQPHPENCCCFRMEELSSTPRHAGTGHVGRLGGVLKKCFNDVEALFGKCKFRNVRTLRSRDAPSMRPLPTASFRAGALGFLPQAENRSRFCRRSRQLSGRKGKEIQKHCKVNKANKKG